MLKTGLSFKCMDAKATHCRVHSCYHPCHNTLEQGDSIGGLRSDPDALQFANLVMIQASFRWCVISHYSLYYVPARCGFYLVSNKYAFVLPAGSTTPMCVICNETVALLKSGHVKCHYDTKHEHFEQNHPPEL